MRNQLLNEEQESYDQYKTVRMQIIGDIFAGVRADEPIFRKKSFIYDKYELNKLISFEQFELFMRPFKNDPTYRNYISWSAICGIFMILLILSLAASIPLIEFGENKDSLWFTLWVIVMSSTTVGTFYSTCRILYASGAAKKALKDYCENLDLTLDGITIKASVKPAISNIAKYSQSRKEAPGKYSLFCEVLSHFQIRSTHILNDEKTVKLYNSGIAFSHLNANMESPIFQATNFEFSNGNLERIISFADLEAMLRPFKGNQSFKKSIFYMKAMLLSMLLLIFMVVPLFFNLDKITLMIVLYGYVGVVYTLIFFFLCKSMKAKKQMFIDFVEFCKEVSRKQSRVEIIAQINENEHPSTRQPLFCIEVKIPQN